MKNNQGNCYGPQTFNIRTELKIHGSIGLCQINNRILHDLAILRIELMIEVTGPMSAAGTALHSMDREARLSCCTARVARLGSLDFVKQFTQPPAGLVQLRLRGAYRAS